MDKNMLACLLLGILSVMLSSAIAQNAGLALRKSGAGFYIGHKVLPKEGLFSIGRKYTVHPHFLAAYNGLEPNKGLQIDQEIRVPLSDTNFDRRQGEGVPIYLTASTDDLISDLATFVGTEATLVRCWNAFDGLNVKKSSRWIVGFLKTNEMAERRMKFTCSPKISPPKELAQASNSYFESAFLDQIRRMPVSKDSTILASYFSSQNGWKDGKFYVLLDGVAPGTIIKLVNPENKQEIYAKVLGEMPRIKQNEGLNLRINQAALDRLMPPVRERFSLQLIY